MSRRRRSRRRVKNNKCRAGEPLPATTVLDPKTSRDCEPFRPDASSSVEPNDTRQLDMPIRVEGNESQPNATPSGVELNQGNELAGSISAQLDNVRHTAVATGDEQIDEEELGTSSRTEASDSQGSTAPWAETIAHGSPTRAESSELQHRDTRTRIDVVEGPDFLMSAEANDVAALDFERFDRCRKLAEAVGSLRIAGTGRLFRSLISRSRRQSAGAAGQTGARIGEARQSSSAIVRAGCESVARRVAQAMSFMRTPIRIGGSWTRNRVAPKPEPPVRPEKEALVSEATRTVSKSARGKPAAKDNKISTRALMTPKRVAETTETGARAAKTSKSEPKADPVRPVWTSIEFEDSNPEAPTPTALPRYDARTAQVAPQSRFDRDTTWSPDVSVPNTQNKAGSDFLMFSTAQRAASFDFEQLDHEPAEQKKHGGFLDALSIPERLLRSILPVGRDKHGNRANLIALGWDAAELDEKLVSLRKWVVIRRIKEERSGPELLNGIALTAMFTLALYIGVGAHRKLSNRPAPPEAKSYNVTSVGSRSAPVAEKSPVRRAQVFRDDLGSVVEIRGADPGSVLVGFCKANQGGLCEPVELAWPDPPQPQLRIGIFRAFYDMRAIRIRRDPQTRQWVAGDGSRQIDDVPAHNLRMGITRVPIARHDDES